MGNLSDLIFEDLTGEEKTVPRYLEYEEPVFSLEEALRYSGFPMDKAKAVAGGETEDPDAMQSIEKVKKLSKGQFIYKVGYMTSPITFDEDGFVVLPFKQHSEALKINLSGCKKAVFFAATIGSGIDRLIRRYERTELDTALFLQGFGAERAESLANAFNADVKEAAKKLGFMAHPRFSPGFGDLPLSVQVEFLGMLDATRRMGITLGESYLMAPSKSVTAIIGLEQENK